MKYQRIEHIAFVCIVVIFLIENIYLFLNINSFSRAFINKQTKYESVENDRQENLKLELITMIESLKLNGEQLRDINLYPVSNDSQTVKSDSLAIYKLLNNYNILLRFSQYNCVSCVHKILENLQENFDMKDYNCRILIITDKINKNMYHMWKQKGDEINIFETNQSVITNYEEETMPYLALVDSSGRILSALSFSSDNLKYIKYFVQMCQKKMDNEKSK